jgi:hypothetical protein
METSQFIEKINKYFPGIVISVVEKLNDTTVPLPYLHKQLLRKDFSVTGKWESLSSSKSIVMADVVAMDSELPLKKRDSITKATGEIPKMGMELKLNEQQLTSLYTLIATGGTESQIASMLFEDTPKVISGVYERNESIFLQGLSTGFALVETDTVGTGVRIDYGYKTENKLLPSVTWATSATAKPIDDIEAAVQKATADGITLGAVYMDKTAFNNMVKTTQFKEMFAFSQNFVGGNIPAPSMAQAQGVLLDRFGLIVQIVDRSVRYEKNGTQTTVKPWADGRVVFAPAGQLGSLVWARLAEDISPVAGVAYQKADEYILVSKFRVNRPSLAEFTKSEARVIPVISGVNGIYTLDTKTAQS